MAVDRELADKAMETLERALEAMDPLERQMLVEEAVRLHHAARRKRSRRERSPPGRPSERRSPPH